MYRDAPDLQDLGIADARLLVWPSRLGTTVAGVGIVPLIASAPAIAQADPRMYRWLALVDVLRGGDARERAFARAVLPQLIAALPRGNGWEVLDAALESAEQEFDVAGAPDLSEREMIAAAESGKRAYREARYGSARAPEVHTSAVADGVPLSDSGRATRDLIARPRAQRTPVGYNRDLLFSYQPGETWYLPTSLRRHLSELGRTPDDPRSASTFTHDVLRALRIDLSWSSSVLDGNTYSRLDTQNLLEFGQQAEGKDATETQMILNHAAAIERLAAEVEAPAFPRTLLSQLHHALAEHLLPDATDAGRLRERPVQITGTTYTPIAIPEVIRDCQERIIDIVSAIPDPIEQAFFLLVHLPYLQPYLDGNKRTSRVAANWPLLHTCLHPLSFVEVPTRAYVEGMLAVYELQRVDLLRDVFAWAYERSCARYGIVRESYPHVDPLRLRYREALREVVRDTVRAGEAPQARALRDRGAAVGVAADDLAEFAERVIAELLCLDDATATRYGLHPSEQRAWRERLQTSMPLRVRRQS